MIVHLGPPELCGHLRGGEVPVYGGGGGLGAGPVEAGVSVGVGAAQRQVPDVEVAVHNGVHPAVVSCHTQQTPLCTLSTLSVLFAVKQVPPLPPPQQRQHWKIYSGKLRSRSAVSRIKRKLWLDELPKGYF